MNFEYLGKSVNYGGLILKNPIIFAPTSLGYGEDEYVDFVRRLAKGGCSMIVIGDVPVGKKGFGSLYSKKYRRLYERIIEAAHSENCFVCAQLHCSDSNWKAMIKYVPKVLMKKVSMSDLRRLLNDEVSPFISNMPVSKVREIIDCFGQAAVMAKDIGFDMVQVHGDRMCGSFSSPIFNKRVDEYGGSCENRFRFAVECVKSVRAAAPNMPIDFKLAVRQENPHYGNAGVLVEEIPIFVPMLEDAGVTSFHVALANHSDLTDTIPPKNHVYFGEEGCFLKFCDEVKKVSKLPVCAVGGFTDPVFAEKQLRDKRVDCIAMSRQLVADCNWPNKVLSGDVKSINRCVRCNSKCLGGIMAHKGVHCIYDKEVR